MRCTAVIWCNSQRTIGYGPFSAVARARQTSPLEGKKPTKAHNDATIADNTSSSSASYSHSLESPSTATPNVMQNVQLQTNLNLRLSLSNLEHPSHLNTMTYQSESWRLAMCRLYRTILRLHNKTIAVSIDKARRESPEAAIAAGIGGRSTTNNAEREWSHNTSSVENLEEPSHKEQSVPANVDQNYNNISNNNNNNNNDDDNCMLRYLLNDEQRAFGNFFVHLEFVNHIDADALTACTFYASWYNYVCSLASGITSRELTEQERRQLTDEQQERLRTLHKQLTSLQAPPHEGSGKQLNIINQVAC